MSYSSPVWTAFSLFSPRWSALQLYRMRSRQCGNNFYCTLPTAGSIFSLAGLPTVGLNGVGNAGSRVAGWKTGKPSPGPKNFYNGTTIRPSTALRSRDHLSRKLNARRTAAVQFPQAMDLLLKRNPPSSNAELDYLKLCTI
jgi:hypothetical protein